MPPEPNQPPLRSLAASPFRQLRGAIARFPAVILLTLGLMAATSMIGASPLDAKHQKTCTTSECHAMPSATDGAVAHTPFLEEQCDRCHTDHSGAEKGLLKAAEPALCLECHKDVEMKGDVTGHATNGESCTTCHNPHRSEVRHLLRTDEMRLGCVKCHGEDLARERAKPHHHKYFDPEKECGSCHFAHSNSAEKYLRTNIGETCLTCHDMSIQVEGRKLDNIGARLHNSKVLHSPANQGKCQACHTPHGSEQPSLLKDSYPAGNYEKYERSNYQLCWQCHNPETVEASPTRTATQFRAGSTNLHQVHVVKFGKGRACHLCHTAHAADRPHLLRDTVRFGSWAGKLDYTTSADGGTCTTACHRPKTYSRSAP